MDFRALNSHVAPSRTGSASYQLQVSCPHLTCCHRLSEGAERGQASPDRYLARILRSGPQSRGPFRRVGSAFQRVEDTRRALHRPRSTSRLGTAGEGLDSETRRLVRCEFRVGARGQIQLPRQWCGFFAQIAVALIHPPSDPGWNPTLPSKWVGPSLQPRQLHPEVPSHAAHPKLCPPVNAALRLFQTGVPGMPG